MSSEPDLKYAKPKRLSRTSVEALLRSGEPSAVCEALVAAAFYDPERRWVEAQCALLAEHSSSEVRGLVATCLGHLARIHKTLDRSITDPILRKLAADSEPEVRGRVQDALGDMQVFLASGNANPTIAS
jgi:hypothetical protein